MEKRGKITITSLTKQNVNTKYGDKEKWWVNNKFASFVGSWNNHWVVGGEAEGMFVSRQYDNKEYWDIKCPPELKPQQPQDNSFVMGELAVIKSMIQQLLDKGKDTVPVNDVGIDDFSSSEAIIEDIPDFLK